MPTPDGSADQTVVLILPVQPIARGAAYLIGHFDGDGRLKSASVTRGGRVTVLEYDARGLKLSDASIAF